MLAKHRNEKMYFHDLKKKLCCEIERIEARVCGACHDISYNELKCLEKACKALYYLDCITKGYEMHEVAAIDYESDTTEKVKVKAAVV